MFDEAIEASQKRDQERKKREAWTKKARSADERHKMLMDLKAEYAEVTELNDADIEELEEREMMTVSELLEGIGERLKDVSDKLSHEEALAKEIHSMGGIVSKETKMRIKALHDKHDGLLKLHRDHISPNVTESFKAIGKGEELLIPKPEVYDELMSDADLDTAEEEIKADASKWLKQETELREEAEITEGIISDIIDEINTNVRLAEDAKRPELRHMAFGFITKDAPVLQGYMEDQYEALKDQRAKLQEIELNLGMIKRLEGREAA